jgi:hypothetical protein
VTPEALRERAREAARRWYMTPTPPGVGMIDDLAAALDRYAEAHLSAWRAARRDPADGGPLLCDLCQEPAQEWRWVDEGWSLACLPCINKVAEARVAEARTPPGEWYSRAALDHAVAEAVGALTMDDDAAGKWWWQSTAIAAKWPETEAWDLMPQPMKNVFIHHGQAALAALRQRTATSVTPPPTGADTAGLRAALDRLLRLHLVECADETECGAVIEARAALAAPAPESNPQD